MKQNIRIAKQLVKLAKSLMANIDYSGELIDNLQHLIKSKEEYEKIEKKKDEKNITKFSKQIEKDLKKVIDSFEECKYDDKEKYPKGFLEKDENTFKEQLQKLTSEQLKELEHQLWKMK